MFRTAINKLFEKLFARVLASQRGGPGLIPGQGMSVAIAKRSSAAKLNYRVTKINIWTIVQDVYVIVLQG